MSSLSSSAGRKWADFREATSSPKMNPRLLPKQHVVAAAVAIILTAVGSVMIVRVGVLGLLILVAAVITVVLTWSRGIGALALPLALVAFAFSTLIAVRITESVTFSDVALVGLLAVAAVAGSRTHALSGVWRFSTAAVALVIAGGVLGSIVAGTPENGVTRLFQYAISVLICLGLVAAYRPSRHQLRLLAAAYGFGAIASAVVAFGENTGHRPVGLSLHSNHLAIGAVLASSALIAYAVSGPATWRRAFPLAGWVVLTSAIVASGSRAGLIGLAAATVAVIIGLRARKMMILAGVGGAVVGIYLTVNVIAFGPGNAIGRLIGSDDSAAESDVGRTIIYERTIDGIMERPIFGSGFVNARAGHSVYLQYWDAAGLLGLIGIAAIVVVALVAWVLAYRNRDGFAVALWSGFIGYLVAAIASNQMWDRYIWLAFALAVLASMSKKTDEEPRNQSVVAASASSLDGLS